MRFRSHTGRAAPLLDFFILFFYASLVFLWFKNSIRLLINWHISYLIPLTGLFVTGGIRLFFSLKDRKLKLNFRLNKGLLILLILIILAILIRIPYLAHADGLSDSDDAIPALMGKHISEGKLPPVYFYGQLYLGSLPSHFFGLIFSLFGYSFLISNISALFFFLVFLVLQFLFLQKNFSYKFAALATFFYCLPIGLLVENSLDCSRADSLVFLLGFSLIFLAYGIYFQSRENLLPLFGLLSGIAFWTHQILICYILTALVLVVFRLGLRWKKYLVLGVYFTAGFLPVLMMEIFWKFPLFKFLFGGGSGSPIGEKINRAAHFTLALVSLENSPARFGLLILLILGFVRLFVRGFKKGRLSPPAIYCLFPMIFYGIYLLSGFSDFHFIRYLFPLYFCLPVLLLSAFSWIKTDFKYVLMLGFILVLFFGFNFGPMITDFRSVKNLSTIRRQAIASVEETGQRYWRSGYWSAYLVSALSEERIIVDSYSINRYFPYRLEYYNHTPPENLIFMKNPQDDEFRLQDRLCRLLTSLGIEFKLKSFENGCLIYGVESPVYTNALLSPVPSNLPEIEILNTSTAKGFLHLTFRNSGEKNAFTPYRIHFEIPGYSSFVRDFPLNLDSAEARIPFPEQESFTLRCYIDYRGLIIPASRQELEYVLSPQELLQKRNRIVLLSGIGPKVGLLGKQMRICEKNASFEINSPPGRNQRILLYLHSLFEFNDLTWYGNYSQAVSVYQDNRIIKYEELGDGANLIVCNLDGSGNRPKKILLTLEFKYAAPFRITPYWKTAALLEKIELEQF